MEIMGQSRNQGISFKRILITGCFGRPSRRILVAGCFGVFLIGFFLKIHVSQDIMTQQMATLLAKHSQPSHLAGVMEPKALVTPLPRYCKVYNMSEPLDEEYKCVNIKLRGLSTKICIYDAKEDVYISNRIKLGGLWEGNHVNYILDMLRKYPDAGLMDIGANIGMFTLPAAKLGRQIVAVEMNIESVKRIQKAAQLSGTSQLITMVTNGISDERVTMKIWVSKTNKGDTQLASMDCVSDCGYSVNTILFNDLLEVIPFKTAILKIDIELMERKLFVHAAKLLDTIFVPIIFMEFHFKDFYVSASHQSKDKTEIINLIKLLLSKGYTPMQPMGKGPVLDPESWVTWPNDVTWVKNKANATLP